MTALWTEVILILKLSEVSNSIKGYQTHNHITHQNSMTRYQGRYDMHDAAKVELGGSGMLVQ